MTSICGKPVFDGAGKELGVLEGLEFDVSETATFLRITGDQLLKIRGRRSEFVPLAEIDYVDEKVQLYKDLKSLKPVIQNIDMSQKKSYRVKDLVGMTVEEFNHDEIGVLRDVSFTKDSDEVQMIVEGERLAEIAGQPRAEIPISTVMSVTKSIQLQFDYETLKKRISENFSNV